MATMRNQCLLSLLVLGALWRQTTAVTNCYICESTIGTDGIEKMVSPTTGSCASLTGITPTAQTGDFACQTKFTTAGGFTTIKRSGPLTPIETAVKGCTNGAGDTICTCITDKCNSETVAASLALECYDCTSSDYFDNGCGAKLNSGSAFVRITKGCSACYKNVYVQKDHSILYTRGCTRSVALNTECQSDESESQSCGCKKSLCNSAETVSVKSVTAFAAVVLSAVFKLML